MSHTEQNRTIKLVFYIVVSLSFTLFNSDNSFFWDSILQVSVPANWYFDHNFTQAFLPDEYATGHSTIMGFYLAVVWKVFGRSLLTSHMAMLPFVFGIIFQLHNLIGKARLNQKDSGLILMAVACDATLLSQISMVTFDVAHIFFFLWCLNSILDKRNFNISISFTFLMLTSLRASLSGFGILPFALYLNYLEEKHFTLEKIKPFLPGLAVFGILLVVFYLEKGWIIANPKSADYNLFLGFASIKEVLRNIGLVGWRLIDFGRVGLWLVFLGILINSVKKKTLYDPFFRNIFFIALFQLMIIFPFVIIFKNPFGHRYFLPVIISVAIIVTYWVLKYSRLKYVLFSLIFLVLLTGYFWIYPLKIAQGWDATPAHWPYFKVRAEMMIKIKEMGIPYNEIGTFFPNNNSTKYIDLKDNGIDLKDADLLTDNYILYSNIYNVDDIFIDELFKRDGWEPYIETRRGRVFMTLFRKIN